MSLTFFMQRPAALIIKKSQGLFSVPAGSLCFFFALFCFFHCDCFPFFFFFEKSSRLWGLCSSTLMTFVRECFFSWPLKLFHFHVVDGRLNQLICVCHIHLFFRKLLVVFDPDKCTRLIHLNPKWAWPSLSLLLLFFSSLQDLLNVKTAFWQGQIQHWWPFCCILFQMNLGRLSRCVLLFWGEYTKYVVLNCRNTNGMCCILCANVAQLSKLLQLLIRE